MQSNSQGRALALCGLIMLGVLGASVFLWGACEPVPPIPTDFNWPSVSTMAIYAVNPSTDQVLGRDGSSLIIRWNNAVPAGTTPTVSLLLTPDPNDGDPNDGNWGVAQGIDAATSEWPFSGSDIDSNLVHSGIYRVQYTIQDGPNSATDSSTGTIIVPMRFSAPSADVTIFQTQGLLIEADAQIFSNTVTRLDIALSVDPNDANDNAFLNSAPILFGTGASTLPFDGTIFDDPNDANEPNHLVAPNVYTLRARIFPSGGQGPFFIEARGRITIVADP
jgi:hypothetical protein